MSTYLLFTFTHRGIMQCILDQTGDTVQYVTKDYVAEQTPLLFTVPLINDLDRFENYVMDMEEYNC